MRNLKEILETIKSRDQIFSGDDVWAISEVINQFVTLAFKSLADRGILAKSLFDAKKGFLIMVFYKPEG